MPRGAVYVEMVCRETPFHIGDAVALLGVRIELCETIVLPALRRAVLVSIRVDQHEPDAEMRFAFHASRSVVFIHRVLMRPDRHAVGRHVETPLARRRQALQCDSG